MQDKNILNWICWVVVLVGGVNWGLFGLFKIDLVAAILGTGFLARIVYILVGAAAGYIIYLYFTRKNPAA
jgi:uncharacterized membrane protein YuzA (DUF378 family)